MESNQEKNIGVLAHASAFAGLVFPFGNIIAPFIIYYTQKNSKLISDNARNALNFQISTTIYMIVSAFLCLFIVGFFLLFALMIFWLVAVIMAMVKASEGKVYEYPLTINFIN